MDRLVFCRQCGQQGLWQRNPAGDIRGKNNLGEWFTIEYSYKCVCGARTVHPSPDYLTGVNK